MKRFLTQFVTCCALSLAAAGTTQASILYYQFEGADGSNAGAILDSSGNGIAGVAAGYPAPGGVAPTYSSQNVGAQIRDGVSGGIVNLNNTSSIRFTNAGVASGLYNQNSGGRVTVTDQAALRPANFTVEAFVKVNTPTQFASLIGKERAGGATWQLDTSPTLPNPNTGADIPSNMNLRARIDHQATGTSAADGSNQSFGGGAGSITTTTSVSPLPSAWHHVAMTYERNVDIAGVARDRVTLFVDYVQVATGLLNTPAGSAGDLVYDTGIFFIGGGGGGRGFDGWMDEVRFTDGILNKDQFLYVVIPEPSHALLLLAGLMTFGLRRRR